MITTPTLLLDKAKCKENIKAMADKTKLSGTLFRPHFKTHQSLEIGRWFRDVGVSRITVSSLSMAEYFAPEWDDITVAIPVNILEMETINKLAGQIRLNVLVESTETIQYLSKEVRSPIRIFIKIDVGYHRTGIDPENLKLIDNILEVIENNPLLTFDGFLAHAGHTYHCKNKTEVLRVFQESKRIMNSLKAAYIDHFPRLIVSLGDTPSCSLAANFDQIDEVRPGNFVFYDLMQHQIGACAIDQIAVAVACPIIAIHKDRNEIIVYGGGVHFSKDRLEEAEGVTFGRVAEKAKNGWGNLIPGAYVKSLSQEHGIVVVPKNKLLQYQVGDVLPILPVHACMTADLTCTYAATDGSIISKFY